MQEDLHEAGELIEMICEDSDCSKRLKEHLMEVKKILEGEEELKVQKAIHSVEELDLQGISTYLRSQMWDLISLLESMTAS
ncbi:hypothetical protein HOA92_06890 [archaeon]|jgi:uncharacterized protein (UPF0147 family)|nr:hypothetical protein [archaeon]MBT6762739.1 hypothetical protein [archaeon]